MSATARPLDGVAADPAAELEAVELAYLDELAEADQDDDFARSTGTEYATRGARKLKTARPNLRMVSPLRAERASRGMFALVVTAFLIVGMVVILVINTTIAQGSFTVSELQAQLATLTQQEQSLSRSIAAAAAPDALEQKARAMGMIPSESPVFLNPDGSIVGKPKPARGSTSQPPLLRTPADATSAEAVDNAASGVAQGLPPDYDPAAADAAQRQAQSFNEPRLGPAVTAAQRAASTPVTLSADAAMTAPASTSGVVAPVTGVAGTSSVPKTPTKPRQPSTRKVTSQWSDTVIAVSGLSSGDAGLTAVPAR
jgi:hypothetical protein